MEEIIEGVIVVVGVIAYLQIGVFIGRTFGTFEKFVLWHLQRLERALKEWESNSISPDQTRKTDITPAGTRKTSAHDS